VDNGEAFTTIAELSFTLAAAAGIILALTGDPTRWRQFDSVRVLWLLTVSLGSGILALIPLGLHMTGLSSVVVWRISSGLMFLFFGLFWVHSLRQIASLPSEERKNFRRGIAIPSMVGHLAMLLSQLLNSLGFVFHGSSSVYFFGLLWLLAWAALVFVLLIFLRPRSAA